MGVFFKYPKRWLYVFVTFSLSSCVKEMDLDIESPQLQPVLEIQLLQADFGLQDLLTKLRQYPSYVPIVDKILEGGYTSDFPVLKDTIAVDITTEDAVFQYVEELALELSIDNKMSRAVEVRYEVLLEDDSVKEGGDLSVEPDRVDTTRDTLGVDVLSIKGIVLQFHFLNGTAVYASSQGNLKVDLVGHFKFNYHDSTP